MLQTDEKFRKRVNLNITACTYYPHNPKDFLVYDHVPNTYNEFITQFGINPEKNSTDSRKK